MTSMMLSWPMSAAALASWKKRSTTDGLAAISSCSTLRATFFPISGCSHRYTVPIPPAPSFDLMR